MTKEKKTGRPEMARSEKLGLHAEMRSTEMQSIYQKAVGNIEANATKEEQKITVDVSKKVGAAAREQKATIKALTNLLGEAKGLAHEARKVALRQVQSDYDRDIHHAETVFNDQLSAERQKFTEITTPLEMNLKTASELIKANKSVDMADLTEEFRGMFDERVALEKKLAADAANEAVKASVEAVKASVDVETVAPANDVKVSKPAKGSVEAAIGSA